MLYVHQVNDHILPMDCLNQLVPIGRGYQLCLGHTIENCVVVQRRMRMNELLRNCHVLGCQVGGHYNGVVAESISSLVFVDSVIIVCIIGFIIIYEW